MAGQSVVVGGREVRAQTTIPAGHKIALRDIAAAEQVVRYGCSIGKALATIPVGDHVHTQNLAFEGVARLDELPTEERVAPAISQDVPTFLGFERPDGRAGTRNYIAVVAA